MIYLLFITIGRHQFSFLLVTLVPASPTLTWLSLPISDKVNFRKKSPLASSINILEYDYESLTHYGRFTFSFNNQPTIVTKDVSKQGLIGQRNYFSSSDIRKIEMYYNCGKQDYVIPVAMHNGAGFYQIPNDFLSQFSVHYSSVVQNNDPKLFGWGFYF